MTQDDRPDLARGFRFVEKLIAGEIEGADDAKLTDDEVVREMREEGITAGVVPSAKELIDRVEKRARARAAAARSGTAGSALAEGTPLGSPSPSSASPAPPRAVSRRPPSPSARTARPLFWLLAAALAVVLIVFVKKSDLLFPSQEARPTDLPTPRERAEGLRSQARAECDVGSFASCRDSLDQARALDPSGDEAPWILQERVRIEEALTHDVRGATPEKK